VTALPVVLASASPRRAELLTAAGISFDVLAVDVDESVRGNETPDEHVRRLAEAKARAAAAQRPDAIVVAADTIVVVDRHILGKPRDAEHAAAMLRSLSGRVHAVMTGVAVISQTETIVDSAHTAVTFAQLNAEEIADYVASGEPMDKAGAYAIQGLASRFVLHIEGSHSNVVGLPVALVYRMLQTVNSRRAHL
jgi:septum formation protein